ncbi:hypothetical protein ACGFYE_39655 [Streptomyces zaomyceticus]|uniref:hypothetical protein n=1 Tax=Streptomyces zaomyceticus TaxID=68286 RepID=UPI003710AFAC
MSDWGIALIAAGSAIAGSIVTGFLAWKAGHRQAGAAEHAGNRQADALIATVQATLDEQRRARTEERRRQVYADLLTAGQAWELGASDGEHQTLSAFHRVEMEGPEYVAEAALDYASAAGGASRDPVYGSAPARETYLKATRRALNET